MDTLAKDLRPMQVSDLAALIPAIPDFPKAGILFRDIMPLLANPKAFAELVSLMAQAVKQSGSTAIVGLEARGFIFGVAIAQELGLPFVAARKAGKLPGETVSIKYALEYGEQTLEMTKNLLKSEDRVAVVDDLLATGGTAKAAGALIEKLGAEVSGYFFAIELSDLAGRAALSAENIHSVMQF